MRAAKRMELKKRSMPAKRIISLFDEYEPEPPEEPTEPDPEPDPPGDDEPIIIPPGDGTYQ